MRIFRNIPYILNGCNRQQLDLYLPDGRNALIPLVIWIHGGAWEKGSKDECPCQDFVQLGYAVASIGYRLSQQAVYPAQIEDCKAAVRWLRGHAPEYGFDPWRIGAWGGSAGGHLAALLGTTGHIRDFDVGSNLDQSSKVQCVVDWFGPVDFLNWGEPENPKRDSPESAIYRLIGVPVSTLMESARLASPVFFVSSDSSPFLIMHGDQDGIVPVQQSQILHDALRRAGVETSLKIIPGATHGGPDFINPASFKLIKEFIDLHLLRRALSAT